MAEHHHDNLPVHMRTFTDPDGGEQFVQIGVEVDGVFHPFNSVHASEFEKVHDHLKNGVPAEAAE